MAVVMLLIMMLGCAPADNTVTIQQQTPVAVDNKSIQVPPVDDYSIEKTRIVSLESELANCQSTNIKLQKQIDQSASAYHTPTIKEPVSGDSGFYAMKGQGGPQNPDKYITWNIQDLSCSAGAGMHTTNACYMRASVTNNHPNMALTNITVNGLSIESAGSDYGLKINAGEQATFTKSLPISGIVDFQIRLGWVWQ